MRFRGSFYFEKRISAHFLVLPPRTRPPLRRPAPPPPPSSPPPPSPPLPPFLPGLFPPATGGLAPGFPIPIDAPPACPLLPPDPPHPPEPPLPPLAPPAFIASTHFIAPLPP